MNWSADVEVKRQELVASGTELVEVIGPKDAPCGHRKWVGKTLLVQGHKPFHKSLDDALADGLLSEGCQHDLARVLDLS